MFSDFFRKRLPYRVSAQSWAWVLTQFSCLAFLSFSAPLICLSIPSLMVEMAGILLAISGLFRLSWTSFSVFPEPRPDGRLETSGIYSLIRHPMYAGLLIIGTVLVYDFPGIFRFTALFILAGIFILKIRMEEKWLAERYPEFGKWKTRTFRLIPFIW
jgi:protein-S-isoprenylcysteine O-methyltransferase Ste14